METIVYFLKDIHTEINQIKHLPSNISTLNLQKNDLSQYSPAIIKEIFIAIPLHVLDLKLNHCQLKKICNLADFFACLPRHLKSLDLSWNELTFLSAKAVSQLPRQLEKINLSLNEFDLCLDQASFLGLCNMLKALPKSLKVMDFSANNLWYFENAQYLCEILASLPDGLEVLDLSVNGLAYCMPTLKTIFNALPKSLHTLNLSHNNYNAYALIKPDLDKLKQAIQTNEKEVIDLLCAIPKQIKQLQLQYLRLSMDALRLELSFWENLRHLKTLSEQVSPEIKNNLGLIIEQFDKLYASREDLITIDKVLLDCLTVVQGKMPLEMFRQKAKVLQGYASPLWHYLGTLMLALSAILCGHGLYVYGGLGLLLAGGLFYKGRSSGLYQNVTEMERLLNFSKKG